MPKDSINKTRVLVPAITAALVLLMAPAMLSTGAFAQNPHLVGRISTDSDISGDTATISVSGKIAGLGSEETVVFLTADSVTVETECDNPGRGANPPGQDATFEDPTGERENITPRNGQVTFRDVELSVTVTAEQADCPPSMDAVITSATFENVVLHVEQPAGNEVLTESLGDLTAT
jgi:hypothetical protein